LNATAGIDGEVQPSHVFLQTADRGKRDRAH
jgi:hypothetical protein